MWIVSPRFQSELTVFTQQVFALPPRFKFGSLIWKAPNLFLEMPQTTTLGILNAENRCRFQLWEAFVDANMLRSTMGPNFVEIGETEIWKNE